VTFASSSETHLDSCGLTPGLLLRRLPRPFHLRHRRLPGLFRLRCRRFQSEAPLLGFSKDLLSTSIRITRPLPDGLPSLGTRLPVPVLVPPLPFLPASTVFSARSFAGLFHPATGPEVRPVSDLPHHRPRASPLGAPDPSIFPGAPFTPFRAFPSSSAAPRHRGPCLLIIFSMISRLYSSDESVVSTPRCRWTGPDALLGFVPLQGSPQSLNLLQSARIPRC